MTDSSISGPPPITSCCPTYCGAFLPHISISHSICSTVDNPAVGPTYRIQPPAVSYGRGAFIKFWGIRIPCIGPGVHFQVGFSRKSRPTALKFGRASYVDLPSGFLRNCVPYGGAAQKHHHTDQTVKYAAIFSTRQKLPVFLIKKTGEEVLPEPSGTMIRGQRFPHSGRGCIVKYKTDAASDAASVLGSYGRALRGGGLLLSSVF